MRPSDGRGPPPARRPGGGPRREEVTYGFGLLCRSLRLAVVPDRWLGWSSRDAEGWTPAEEDDGPPGSGIAVRCWVRGVTFRSILHWSGGRSEPALPPCCSDATAAVGVGWGGALVPSLACLQGGRPPPAKFVPLFGRFKVFPPPLVGVLPPPVGVAAPPLRGGSPLIKGFCPPDARFCPPVGVDDPVGRRRTSPGAGGGRAEGVAERCGSYTGAFTSTVVVPGGGFTRTIGESVGECDTDCEDIENPARLDDDDEEEEELPC